MTDTKHDNHSHLEIRESRLKKFAKWFNPYGILIAVFGLIVAIGTLWVEIDLRKATLVAFAEERKLRKETLTALAEERELRKETLVALESEKELRKKTLTALTEERELRENTLEALAADKLLREATLLSILLERFDVAREEEANYSGHIQVFERVARIGMDLRYLDASLVDFSVDDGIDLRGANLALVDFAGSNLSKAKLDHTLLNETNLREAILDRANLESADVTGTYFRDAKGLTQEMLDVACVSPKGEPRRLPKDSRTGKQLVWRGKACEE